VLRRCPHVGAAERPLLVAQRTLREDRDGALVAEGLGAAILPQAAADGANVAVLEIITPRLLRRRAIAWNEAAASPAARGFVTLTERAFQRAR
jgi:hypothetical protein